MNPIKRILNELNGLHYRQEYLCLAKESFPNPIHVYLVERKRIVKDITREHIFKKKENVFLNNNLYKQVQIAYSVPRIISLITVSTGGLYNLFPTDLHGPLDEHYYISSLRHGGEACKQVETARRVVMSRIHSDAYKTVYGLGKNHMQKLKTKENFSFSESLSKTFNFPLPTSSLSYRELELVESFERGIHKLLLYKIISSQLVNKAPFTLAHIHNSYATWRHHNNLPGNYLLR